MPSTSYLRTTSSMESRSSWKLRGSEGQSQSVSLPLARPLQSALRAHPLHELLRRVPTGSSSPSRRASRPRTSSRRPPRARSGRPAFATRSSHREQLALVVGDARPQRVHHDGVEAVLLQAPDRLVPGEARPRRSRSGTSQRGTRLPGPADNARRLRATAVAPVRRVRAPRDSASRAGTPAPRLATAAPVPGPSRSPRAGPSTARPDGCPASASAKVAQRVTGPDLCCARAAPSAPTDPGRGDPSSARTRRSLLTGSSSSSTWEM